jgi:hypothetical protein
MNEEQPSSNRPVPVTPDMLAGIPISVEVKKTPVQPIPPGVQRPPAIKVDPSYKPTADDLAGIPVLVEQEKKK